MKDDGVTGRRVPSTSARTLVATVVGAALAAGLAGYAVMGAGRLPDSRCDVPPLVERSMPAVVTVFAQGGGGNGGSGSGAIISTDGEIVTNDHVIAPAGTSGTIQVLLASGVRLDAELVGTDPATDLAVLRVRTDPLPTLWIGDDAAPRVGQQVVALGAPLGLTGTVTAGIVSALDRDVAAPVSSGGSTVLVGSIQTDASINPGNSGGPLVDCTGRLIGVNTAISTVPDAGGTAGGGSVGIGFAVPATTVRRITDELIATGRATHPTLGLRLAEIPADAASAAGVPHGLFVQGVAAGGPSARAGIQPGDIIVSIGGRPATSMALGQVLGRSRVGEQVELEYWRSGGQHTVTVELTERP